MQDSSILPVPGILCGIFETYDQPCPLFVLEFWFTVPECTGRYLISTLGRVRSISRPHKVLGRQRYHKGRILKPEVSTEGYIRYILSYSPARPKRPLAHRLLLPLLKINTYNKHTVHHINSVRNDNRWFNLEWATHQEQSDRKLNQPKGSQCYQSKLKEFQVLEIRAKYPTGAFTHKQLGIMYNVCESSIKQILDLHTWYHI